jgi:DNA-binding MarR family transcriptional regulator
LDVSVFGPDAFDVREGTLTLQSSFSPSRLRHERVKYHLAMTAKAIRSTEERALDPALDFMRLLWSIEHGLQSTSKRMASSFGITGPQRLVLRIVGQFPDMSAKELAHILHLHPSTITGILQRLVRKGLLEREYDSADRRRVRLRVRRQARRFMSRSSGTVEAAVEAALKEVSARDLSQARKVLWAIATALDQ